MLQNISHLFVTLLILVSATILIGAICFCLKSIEKKCLDRQVYPLAALQRPAPRSIHRPPAPMLLHVRSAEGHTLDTLDTLDTVNIANSSVTINFADQEGNTTAPTFTP